MVASGRRSRVSPALVRLLVAFYVGTTFGRCGSTSRHDEATAGRRDRRPRRRAIRRPTVAALPPGSTTPSSCGSTASRRSIVVTGGKQPGDRFTEAEPRAANYLLQRGVPDGDIMREVEGTQLVGVVAAAARILRKRGLSE